MARAPKIPGLRSWRKVVVARGFRPMYQYRVPDGPLLNIITMPAKTSEGRVSGHYGARDTQAVTANYPTRGEAIRSLKKWLKEYWRETRPGERGENPLTTREAKEAVDVEAEANRSERRARSPQTQGFDRGYSAGTHDAVVRWGTKAAVRAHAEEHGRRHRANPSLTFDEVRPGDRVTILVPAGRNRDGSIDYAERTGRVVMHGPAGWVLNLGGAHGTPGIASPENFVRATKGKRHGGFGTVRGNPVVAAPRSVNPARRYPKASPRTRACVSRKIPKYMHEGMPQKQAAAAAFGKCARKPRRRNPSTGTTCRHTLPLQKGGHGRVTVCFPQGVFPSLKAAIVNIQRELRAKFGRLKAAPAIARADWAYSDAGRTRGRWTFTG